MDDEPRRRYTNGSISETLSTRLLQTLSETNLDRWGDDERANLRANNRWVTKHRQDLGTWRRARAVLISAMIAITVAFVSWLAPWKGQTCPPGYVCTQTPIVSPMP